MACPSASGLRMCRCPTLVRLPLRLRRRRRHALSHRGLARRSLGARRLARLLARAGALRRAIPDQAARHVRGHRGGEHSPRRCDHDRAPRLPSVFAATIATCSRFSSGRSGAYRRSSAGRHGRGTMLPMPQVSFLWLDRAPSAEIDMLQMMWVSAAAILSFWRAVECEDL